MRHHRSFHEAPAAPDSDTGPEVHTVMVPAGDLC